MLFSFLVVLVGVAPSPVPGTDVVGWLLESVQWVITQFQAKNYLPACGMMVMIMVWTIRQVLGDKLRSENLALLAAGLGLLASVSTELLGLALGSSKFDIIHALATGLMVGAAASGFWSLLGKKLFNGKNPTT